MKEKKILKVIFFVILLYPVYSLFHLGQMNGSTESMATFENSLSNYQISIWISWVFLVSISVYHKWRDKKNFFFYCTYGFLVVAFALFGFFYQEIVNIFNIKSPFEDGYTLGVLIALQKIVMSGIMTAVLQACTWWFTRRWHRRYR